jgi:hypothetical protein
LLNDFIHVPAGPDALMQVSQLRLHVKEPASQFHDSLRSRRVESDLDGVPHGHVRQEEVLTQSLRVTVQIELLAHLLVSSV